LGFFDGLARTARRQFDGTEGGGFADPDTYARTDESDTPSRGFLGIGNRQFGDGSNRWIPGLIETARNPVDRATNPYDTLAGAADAAALNFDEGVGGLVSTVDGEPGNTAGPGDDDVVDQSVTPGGTAVVLVVVVVAIAALLWLGRPLLEIIAAVVE
jgi:hypothetical protein